MKQKILSHALELKDKSACLEVTNDQTCVGKKAATVIRRCIYFAALLWTGLLMTPIFHETTWGLTIVTKLKNMVWKFQ